MFRPAAVSISIAVLHALLVGYLFSPASGGGENFVVIAMLDLPLYTLGELLFPRLMVANAAFVITYFTVVGSAMYGLAVFFAWRLARWFRGQHRASSDSG